MCGIVGYVGDKKVTDVLLTGLKALEYRGYDSSGISVIKDKKIKTIKSVGKVASLEEKINKEELDDTTIGIAHTRWATHGSVNEVNSHPHTLGKITLVHNGIIENFRELKIELKKKGYVFNTETDTEVICALIDSFYKGDLVSAIDKAKEILIGSYALLIMTDEDEKLYAVRKNSPLIIGVGENDNYVASDICAILKYTKNYIEVDENKTYEISKSNVKALKDGKEVKTKTRVAVWELEDAQKQGYDHFMLKEINEQIPLSDKIASKYIDGNDYSEDLISLMDYERIDIVACGSAYHAGLIGKSLLDNHNSNGYPIINVDVASEYRYKNHYYGDSNLLIVLSQSGETADTLACLRMAKEKGVDTLAIVNVLSSSIAKESKYVMPMLAGPEISVATTKGYFSQVLDISLLVQKLLSDTNIVDNDDRIGLIKELKGISSKLKGLMDNPQYLEVAEKLKDKEDVYFIGRGLDYSILLESSLKLKEISYIHSDTYAAGELKHGPIALVEKGTPVITLITEQALKDKTVSNAIEVKSRGADLFLIATDDIDVDETMYESVIKIPKTSDFFQTLLAIIPFQLIAYEVAKLRKCDVDKPKNLAKSVTVE